MKGMGRQSIVNVAEDAEFLQRQTLLYKGE